MSEWPKVYAWTPGKPAYEQYPQYANFKVFEDGWCVVTVRAGEFRAVGGIYYQMGETVCIQLPPDAAAELRAFFASADTLPKGQDAQQGLAGTESGAVGATSAETPSPSSSPAAGR